MDVDFLFCRAAAIRKFIRKQKALNTFSWLFNPESPKFALFCSVLLSAITIAVSSYIENDVPNFIAMVFVVACVLFALYYVYVCINDYVYSKKISDFTVDVINFKAEEYSIVYPDENNDLFEVIFQYDLEVFGESDVTDIEKIKLMYNKNMRNICAIMKRNEADKSKEELVAFFIFASININGYNKILNHEIRGINHFEASDFIFKNSEEPYIIYISDIVTVKKYNSYPFSQYILAIMCNELIRVITNSNFRAFVCRPVSEQGTKIAKSFCFESLENNPESPMFHLDAKFVPNSFSDRRLRKFMKKPGK